CTLNLHPVIPIVSTLRSRFFSLMFPPTPASPLFPYTTLFRSERSGHWSHYRQNMFLIESEGETMSLKPMNCPGHFLMYASTTHRDRKSTRLNSSHVSISYAVFCLKKKSNQ